MDAKQASLTMVGVGWGGWGLDEVVPPLPLTADSFIFLLVTSVTLLRCSQEQKKGNLTWGKESKGIWRNSWESRRNISPRLAWPVFHFWHQDWVTADLFGQFTASQPFQCLNVSIMNGRARLKSDSAHHVQPSRHHGFWLEGSDNFGSRPLHCTPRWSIFWIDSRISQ